MSEPCLAIAVVDDEAPVRKALGRLLRASGFGVETFGSGEEFLDSLKMRHPDCAVLDLHLPGLSGLDIKQQLTRKNISMPCIVITGKDEVGNHERALACGVAAYLCKPVDEHLLLAAIAWAVSAFAATRKPDAEKCVSVETGDGINQETPVIHGDP
jgi:FixJ family two-component response regulator